MNEKEHKRIQQLIALAGSNNLEEARNAAHKACRMMTELGVTPAQVMTPVAALPPARGWTPPPAQEPHRGPRLPAPPPNPYAHPQLPPSEDWAEQNRILQHQVRMREAQAARAGYQLNLAQQHIAAIEAEKARLAAVAARKDEQVRLLRAAQAVTVSKPSRIMPTGAGRRELK